MVWSVSILRLVHDPYGNVSAGDDEVDGFADMVGDFVGVDGGDAGKVDHGFDRDGAVAEPLFGLVDGDGSDPFHPRHTLTCVPVTLWSCGRRGRLWVWGRP